MTLCEESGVCAGYVLKMDFLLSHDSAKTRYCLVVMNGSATPARLNAIGRRMVRDPDSICFHPDSAWK